MKYYLVLVLQVTIIGLHLLMVDSTGPETTAIDISVVQNITEWLNNIHVEVVQLLARKRNIDRNLKALWFRAVLRDYVVPLWQHYLVTVSANSSECHLNASGIHLNASSPENIAKMSSAPPACFIQDETLEFNCRCEQLSDSWAGEGNALLIPIHELLPQMSWMRRLIAHCEGQTASIEQCFRTSIQQHLRSNLDSYQNSTMQTCTTTTDDEV